MRPLSICTVMVLLALLAGCSVPVPNEIVSYFGEGTEKVKYANYEISYVDLNDDGSPELVVTNYEVSCEDAGFCNFEIFQNSASGWVHIATIPGRLRILSTSTNGYHDLATWLLGSRYVYVWDGQTYRDIMYAGGKTEE